MKELDEAKAVQDKVGAAELREGYEKKKFLDGPEEGGPSQKDLLQAELKTLQIRRRNFEKEMELRTELEQNSLTDLNMQIMLANLEVEEKNERAKLEENERKYGPLSNA